MSHCQQCKQEINGIDAKSYAVGWCRQDVHVGNCFFLHVRVCPACRQHNERLANEVITKPKLVL